LPTLGNYVVQMLEGKLDAELSKRWAWDRDNLSATNKRMIPCREMID
jgi:hypothetical protein